MGPAPGSCPQAMRQPATTPQVQGEVGAHRAEHDDRAVFGFDAFFQQLEEAIRRVVRAFGAVAEQLLELVDDQQDASLRRTEEQPMTPLFSLEYVEAVVVW